MSEHAPELEAQPRSEWMGLTGHHWLAVVVWASLVGTVGSLFGGFGRTDQPPWLWFGLFLGLHAVQAHAMGQWRRGHRARTSLIVAARSALAFAVVYLLSLLLPALR